VEKKRIIRISIIAVLIYFIAKKSYDLISEIFFWSSTVLQIQNDYIFAFFQVIAALLGLLILVKGFNTILRKETLDNKTIYILIVIYLVLHAVMVLLNIKSVEFDTGDRLVYLRHYGLSRSIEFLFPIIALLYFLRRIWK
jgi:hypothetical protein